MATGLLCVLSFLLQSPARAPFPESLLRKGQQKGRLLKAEAEKRSGSETPSVYSVQAHLLPGQKCFRKDMRGGDEEGMCSFCFRTRESYVACFQEGN